MLPCRKIGNRRYKLYWKNRITRMTHRMKRRRPYYRPKPKPIGNISTGTVQAEDSHGTPPHSLTLFKQGAQPWCQVCTINNMLQTELLDPIRVRRYILSKPTTAPHYTHTGGFSLAAVKSSN